MPLRRALRRLAMVVLLAIFIGASYAATRPRPDPAPVGVPAARPTADVMLVCPPRGTIAKRRFLAVYNRSPMTRPVKA